MKKNVYILLVAVAALSASCSKVTGVEEIALSENAISFGTEISTKSTESTLSTMKADGFQVVAMRGADNVFNQHVENVSWSATPDAEMGNWKYSAVKYWKTTGTYEFAASSKSSVINVAENSTKMSAQYRMTDCQDDILLAYAKCIMGTTKPAGYPKVNLNFNHATAAVQFKIYSKSIASELLLFEVRKMVAGGSFVYEGGNLVWTIGDVDNMNSYLKWTGSLALPLVEADKVDVFSATRAYANGSNTYTGSTAMVIPQNLGTQEVHIQVKVGAETIEHTIPLTSSNNKWESGKKYIYTMSVEGASIHLISIVTTEWDEVLGTTEDIVVS